MRKCISIIGCGWLGEPLAQELSKNYSVECFSRETTKELSPFWKCNTIIIAIHTKDNYLATLKKIITLTSSTCNIILMSSTSVYREFDTDVDENIAITKSSLIKEAEDLLLHSKENVLILRLGGLMGDDRIAGKWKNASVFNDGFVNYIHKRDVIKIVKLMLDKNITNGIYNLVAPTHPTRLDIHKKNSKHFKIIIGTFDGFSNRRVLSNKLINDLGYDFLYPNPLYFWG